MKTELEDRISGEQEGVEGEEDGDGMTGSGDGGDADVNGSNNTPEASSKARRHWWVTSYTCITSCIAHS